MPRKLKLGGENLYVWNTAQKSKFRKSPVWIEFREKLKTERCTCELCGNDNTKKLVVHHRYLNDDSRSYSNLSPERFLVLCQLCHKYIHRLAASANRKKNPIEIKLKELKEFIKFAVITEKEQFE